LRQARGWTVKVETIIGDFGYNAVRALLAGDANHVFLVGNINANSVVPVIHRGLFDIEHWNVVQPVTRLADFPSVACTYEKFPANTLKDFLSRLKQTTGLIRYGTDFLGTYVDIDVIRLAERAGLACACMTAEGAVGILENLEAERIDFALLNVATATAYAARLNPLAISGPHRLKDFPGVATLSECGFAGIGTSNWQGLLASRQAMKDRVALLYGAVVDVMTNAETAKNFADIGARVSVSSSPQQFEAEIKAEATQWVQYAGRIAETPLLER
jgi:tripartite-type tricarboxylate transporter receptor subunit TctC